MVKIKEKLQYKASCDLIMKPHVTFKRMLQEKNCCKTYYSKHNAIKINKNQHYGQLQTKNCQLSSLCSVYKVTVSNKPLKINKNIT